jgi:lipopolysaccharide export system protein LptA
VPSRFSRLRVWFGVSALLTIAVVAGFYGYARYRVHKAVDALPVRLGINIQQNTQGFTYSQSARGRTIYSISASNAVRYKQDGKAELHDVKILSYGRAADRLDQISGDNFEYDTKSGDIMAQGMVAIELQAAEPGTSGPGGNPKKVGSVVHLSADGMVFNKNTGVAQTSGKVTFQFPQASGTAVGATYDSKANTLNLYSDIHLQTSGSKPMNLRAASALYEQEAQVLRLSDLKGESGIRHLDAHRAVLHLRDDNTVERADATDGVTARVLGARTAEVHAAVADFILGPKNEAVSGHLMGGVTWETGGGSASRGNANQVLLAFGQHNEIKSAQLRDNVDLIQLAENTNSSSTAASIPPPAQSMSAQQGNEFRGDGLDLKVGGGKQLEQAHSVGAGQILLAGTQADSKAATVPSKSKTVITAGHFDATFSDNDQISTLTGSEPVKIVSSTPGQPDRISQSHDLLATFSKEKNTTVQDVIQTGNVRIDEAQRHVTADRASYNQVSDEMTLSGNVRYADQANQSFLSSNSLALNRSRGETTATGNVKTTYSAQKTQPAGGLLSAGQTVHMTAQQMVQNNSTGTARYSGQARLWQGQNIVQAPEIELTQQAKALDARSQGNERVSTVFVQDEKARKSEPVEVTADHLHYEDGQRKANFDGSVVFRTADSALRSSKLTVFLRPQSEIAKSEKQPASGAPSQVQSIDATGNILLQQPGRRATGTHLVYTADEGKFVMTGSPASPPSIFDAEHGQVTGVSLTFFNGDDRVLVDSSNSASISQTRLKK